jgi:hypothetical protein
MKVSGVSYEVNWRKFRKGSSMFFPCLDTGAARRELVEVTDRLCIRVITKITIEDGVRGLRVWRV